MARRDVNVGRAIETGAVLAALSVVLAATGLLLSPTVTSALGARAAVEGAGNALYALHMAAALLLVVFVLWHLWPLAHAFARKAGVALAAQAASYALLAVVLVEVATGYVLWSHDYRLVPKATAVVVHLGATAAVLALLAVHGVRGLRAWTARRDARRAAIRAAAARGRLEDAVATHAEASRRAFLRLGAYAGAGLALAWAFGRRVSDSLSAWPLNSVGPQPDIPKDVYRLRVTGLVETPVTLTFAEVLALGPVTKRFTHRCVEGWTYTDEFTGVPLRKVLALARPREPAARQLVLKSAERSSHPAARGRTYTTNFPYEDGLHDDVLLVYRVAGEDLPAEHGGPMRLMTPRKWGYKACKWLVEVEVSGDAGYRGYWESFGYHNDGDWPGPIFG